MMFRTTRNLFFLLCLAVPLGLATTALAGPTGPVCGNGEPEDGEQCDDGNLIGGDGCSATCLLEICGNEIVDPGEQCDDGNTAGGDGCSADCLDEECGNGILDPGEDCDDGNLANGDGCDSQCMDEPDPVCGDGVVNPGEQCDDGNNDDGDGCSANCTIEGDEPFCGDGTVDPGEGCDDGNNDNGDGCSADCMVEVTPVCGDGNLDAGEECDDGNNTDGDGCSANCTIEVTGPACGDGSLDEGEECDDGNTDSGDGCSADCTIEEDGEGQNPGQQACINTMNKRGKDTSKAQSKVALGCFDSSDPDACIAGDPDGKMEKERKKTQTAKEKKCDPENLPDFGFIGSTATHGASSAASIAHVLDLFGDLNEGLSEDKNIKRCQEKVTYASQDVMDKLFKVAGKAKKAALLEGASSALELQNAIVAEIDSEGGMFSSWAHYTIGKAVEKSCGKVDVGEAFPGCEPKPSAVAMARSLGVSDLPKEGVTQCAIDSSRCRWCEAYNGMDGLTIDCDAFDDAVLNGSCTPKELPDGGDDKDD
jgi:cysteine-rich repeat protein